MIIFIVLTTFMLFYTFNFTRILQSTDTLISSRIDKVKNKLEKNVNSIREKWDKIKEEEGNFLTEEDLMDFKNMQNRLQPSNFVNLSKVIDQEEKKFQEWYKTTSTDLNILNISEKIAELSNSKATETDVNDWFKDQYDKVLEDGKGHIEGIFKEKAILPDLQDYTDQLNKKKTEVETFYKKVRSYFKSNVTERSINNLLDKILEHNKEWWEQLKRNQARFSQLVYPSGYIYLQLEGQLKPDQMFFSGQIQMYQEEPQSEFYLENFDTKDVKNASLRVYLWKRY